MRVLLFFPPQCRPLHPYLSLPIVKAELTRRGHTCKIVDLNSRFYKYVLTPAALAASRDAIRDRVDVLDTRRSLTANETIEYYRMATSLVRSRYLIDHVSEAVAVFQSDEFYDYGRFLWARKVLEESLDLY